MGIIRPEKDPDSWIFQLKVGIAILLIIFMFFLTGFLLVLEWRISLAMFDSWTGFAPLDPSLIDILTVIFLVAGALLVILVWSYKQIFQTFDHWIHSGHH